MVKKVEIKLGSNPSQQEVIVDGKDISNLVFGVTVQQDFGETPLVTLGIVAQNENGHPYVNDAKTGAVRRFLQLQPEQVILKGEAALIELVANVDRYEMGRRAGKE